MWDYFSIPYWWLFAVIFHNSMDFVSSWNCYNYFLYLFSSSLFSFFIFILNLHSNRGFNDFSIELFVSVSVIWRARVWYGNLLIAGIELSSIASFSDYWKSCSLLIRIRCLSCVILQYSFLQGCSQGGLFCVLCRAERCIADCPVPGQLNVVSLCGRRQNEGMNFNI